jgi:isopentenyl-diphosphate delta-isomerase
MKIPIVNEQDETIGYRDREGRNINDIVRATCLWVLDKNDNILLAQRAFSKEHDPGLWGPSAGGTVEEGETYELNILKEAEEEIGLIGFDFIKKIKIRVPWGFVCIFDVVVDHDFNFIKQDNEVEQIKWFSKEELDLLLKEKPEIFIKNFKLMYESKN